MAIAVVTGTSTGIGLATAATLARAGHTVYATMRNPKTGGEELRAIAERERLPLQIAALDVDSDESVRSAFANILAEAGRQPTRNIHMAGGLQRSSRLHLRILCLPTSWRKRSVR